MTRKKRQIKVVAYNKLQHKVAAVWTRVSSERQEQENCSLDTQKRRCEEYARLHGITIKKYYGGTHESAKKEGRLYKEMISEVAKDKDINIILVYSFDRFTRAGAEGIFTKAYLKAKGIYVVSATQKTDPDSASGEFMENIIFLFNQFDNTMRRDKCITGMQECLRRGEWYQKPPLGYDHKKVGKHHFNTINDKGRILKNAFIWKATEGATDVEICNRLKKLGLSIDNKKLNSIFHNPFYCGIIRHHLLDEGETIEGTHEKLIDVETYEKICGMRRVDFVHNDEPEEFPLKRHIRCASCGSCFTGYTVKARGRDYYKCSKIGCRTNRSAELMHRKYKALLDRYKIPLELTPILTKVLEKVFRENSDNKEERINIVKKQQSEVTERLRKVRVRFATGDISEDVFEDAEAELKNKLYDLATARLEIEKEISNLEKFVKSSIAFCCKLGDLWSEGNFQCKQKLQNLIFPNGVLFDKEIDDYRTVEVNKVFELYDLISSTYNNKKESKNECSALISRLVGVTRFERAASTSRT